jgi:hypothetical protein
MFVDAKKSWQKVKVRLKRYKKELWMLHIKLCLVMKCPLYK